MSTFYNDFIVFGKLAYLPVYLKLQAVQMSKLVRKICFVVEQLLNDRSFLLL